MEPLALVLVVRQRAAELDVLRQIPAQITLEGFQKHGSQSDRVSFRCQFLAIRHEDGRGAVAVLKALHMLHAIGKEAAGAAGRVVKGADETRFVDEEVVVGVEKELDGQVHHIARGHEVFRGLVHFGTEPADQVLVDVRHGAFGHRIGMKVDLREILANPVEDAGLVYALERVEEVELLEDSPCIWRELGDVIFQVRQGARRAKAGEIIARGIVTSSPSSDAGRHRYRCRGPTCSYWRRRPETGSAPARIPDASEA